MASALRQLPANYATHSVFDLAGNRWLQVFLTLAGGVLFIAFGAVFLSLAAWLRADVRAGSLQLGLTELLIGLATLIAVTYAILVVHEAVHGAAYWLFTHERPHFGLSVMYAFAAAPNWYLTKSPFLIVGLAPLVVLSLLGVGALLVAPAVVIYWIVFALTLNAAGCVGDIAVAVWALRQPRNALFNDRGPAVTAYAPTA